ncbi:AGAP003221-PA [Anopheles gambiae str. PEST]|uniref:AGAP003221-PA n=1 Tax=Anopheles gambiae TaxID=7165 RepID=Q7QBD4_ANOGA|nr:ATP-binding cassette subfamily C member 4 [Anopheles gambiae]XP_061501731.1 ATP-binding cassette subfamily C member 4 [Anopheles gambiae]XP_061501732.1 ATP-binding cassette subfamily C member 4 [Anopheles gambiae]XP_061501733.1 ATP-binding cassette subfamily C member 4 [Anopheles gambiae]XP_061501734.1 ATP-binding cassette subfamily C member 4 [Anopheles gambiae]XP_061501735.1 ATP-binding cassette subfamily C member 4 [Anopheles gambiae]XP_312930.5 ATP-binding cassette subfamily C member 4
MDSSTKPVKKNPRKGAFCLSQLFFGWLLPLFYRGSRRGLGKDDLTKCLKADRSEDLGDELEEQWEKEVSQARIASREPKLRNALFRTFYKQSLFDGFLIFLFVLIKTILPVVLAQLLVQFQEPTNSTHVAVVNMNNDVFSTVPPMAMPLMMLPDTTQSHLENLVFDETAMINKRRRKRRIRIEDDKPAPGNSIGGSKPNVAQEAEAMETTILPDLSEQFGADDPSATANSTVVDDLSDFLHHAWNDAFWLSGLLVLLTLLGCFCCHHSDLRERLVGARMRIACCSLIYRKTLRMSRKAAGQTPAGYMINLLSNDVSRLDYGFIYVHYVWVLPFQACFTCYLIWRRVQWAAIVGVVGLLVKTIPVQTGLSRLSSIIRMRVAKKTDQRVGIMNELIQGIQVIKMYAWEKPFHKVVSLARKKEVRQIRWASYIRGIYLSTMVFTERSTLFLAIACCVIEGRAITADIVFPMAQFFNILQLTAAIFYPLAVSLGAEALVSIDRIQEFLALQEHDATPPSASATGGLKRNLNDLHLLAEHDNKPAIELQNVTASWEETTDKTLKDISVKIEPGRLLAVIGPVGAGKSSLLQMLLGELPIQNGTATINGDVSYGSQEPWLFTGTVRNNILFGLPYDRHRYQAVVRHCALTTDFQQLPDGDKTVVGERGTSLSGGQRARVSLARAVYNNASIYLLDDPLSAVDAHVGKHLFDEVIGPRGYLAQKQKATRVLVTHQVHFLKEADWIVIIEGGKIVTQGTYTELANGKVDFGKLLKSGEPEKGGADDSVLAADIPEDEIPFIDGVTLDGYKLLKGSTVSLRGVTPSSCASSVADNLGRQVAEDQAEGTISWRIWATYFLSGGNVLMLLFTFLMLLFSQAIVSGSDYFVTYWTRQEELRLVNERAVTTTKVDFLYTYGVIIIGVVVFTIFRGYLFFNICMKASRNLHDRMFARMLTAPMRFFDTNPSGRILNRFSKDMGAIDELLPKAMIEAIQILLVMTGILTMITIVNPLLLLPLLGAVLLYAIALKLYLRPIQDMKRLEGITRSPVFSHLSATLSGLSTIRASGVQEKIREEFDDLQNVHSAVWQLTMSSNAALGLWLDCISTAFVACVTFSFIVLHQDTYSANVGLAISQALILTGMVQYGIRQTTESIQQMTAVERVVQYTEIASETDPPKVPPGDWPWKGQIQFHNMSLCYEQDAPPVLKNLELVIEPTWKVGIVGRTGAGKSSLIGALFRLARIEGRIMIDGIDTGVISLEALRSKISIIPQDPVLFSATIRYNLDPFSLYDDDMLWRAIGEVELRSAISGLDFMVTEGGTNFSVGQRQLICLARAILRNNKILVLDEATANVDPQTDALIQKTIREKFKHCTVLTVAHRLHTVMDSDRILVMDAGEAREFDTPHILLQQEGGILKDMVEATGPSESESLKRIAAETYAQMDPNRHLMNGMPNPWRFGKEAPQ